MPMTRPWTMTKAIDAAQIHGRSGPNNEVTWLQANRHALPGGGNLFRVPAILDTTRHCPERTSRADGSRPSGRLPRPSPLAPGRAQRDLGRAIKGNAGTVRLAAVRSIWNGR
jgi:hypothetical protein